MYLLPAGKFGVAISTIIFWLNSQLFRSGPFRSVLDWCLDLEISFWRKTGMKDFKFDLMVFSMLFNCFTRKNTMTRMYSIWRSL